LSKERVLKSVLITGAAKGIGLACTRLLLRRGYRVFAGVRRANDGEALRAEAGQLVVPLLLDVTDAEQIARTVTSIRAEVGTAGLDGLVNNAGIAIAGPLEFLPPAELRRQLEVNVIAQVAVTQAVLPLIRQAHGRIVNMGSISGRSALPMIGPYAASKHALEAITDAWRVELMPWGIKVIVVEPAVIATPIWQTSIRAAEQIWLQLPARALEQYGPTMAALKQRVTDSAARGLAPERVARAVAHALTARRPRTRYLVGRNARLRLLLEALPDRWRDQLIARTLKRLERGA
jgi:NAD(P)-dependent dehydrogenase (short-subunit alcohol dehydrogenase family)